MKHRCIAALLVLPLAMSTAFATGTGDGSGARKHGDTGVDSTFVAFPALILGYAKIASNKVQQEGLRELRYALLAPDGAPLLRSVLEAEPLLRLVPAASEQAAMASIRANLSAYAGASVMKCCSVRDIDVGIARRASPSRAMATQESFSHMNLFNLSRPLQACATLCQRLVLSIARTSIEPLAAHTDCFGKVERQRWVGNGLCLSKDEWLKSVLCSR